MLLDYYSGSGSFSNTNFLSFLLCLHWGSVCSIKVGLGRVIFISEWNTDRNSRVPLPSLPRPLGALYVSACPSGRTHLPPMMRKTRPREPKSLWSGSQNATRGEDQHLTHWLKKSCFRWFTELSLPVCRPTSKGWLLNASEIFILVVCYAAEADEYKYQKKKKKSTTSGSESS